MSATSTKTETTIAVKTPSMWKVILHNDDFTPMDFVVSLLMQLFNKSYEEAYDIMLTVHNKKSAQVGLYTREVAETKAEMAKATAYNYGHPLLATAEEA